MVRLTGNVDFVESYLGSVFAEDLHAKRVLSLALGTLGVMAGASLAVAVIGQSMAQARGRMTKHAIKQVDRLLSNRGIVVWDMFDPWVKQVVGQSTDIVVAMDWTDFDADDQATLVLSLVTSHGRATPLLWLSVLKDELKDQRNDFEDLCLARLAAVLPGGVKVTLLDDRGFGDTKLFEFLGTLGFDYVIRFRGNILVAASDGEARAAAAWVGTGGRARKIMPAAVTAQGHKVGAVVCVKARDMKEAWCLASSHAGKTAREITNLYARRWTIEPSFRDTKDLRFGMGLSALRIADPQRRDLATKQLLCAALLLLNAFAIVLLTLLGTAGESLGMDRQLKSNTSKTRTHSLFRQGCMLYEMIPNMPEHRLTPLIQKFTEYFNQNKALEKLLDPASK